MRPAADWLTGMPGKARHIVAGVAWVVGSFFAWAAVCNLFGFFVFIYLHGERQVSLPAWTADVYNWTSVGGSVLIPAFVAVLAIRAYLPGTGRRPSKLRGFAVVNPRPPGQASPAQ